MQLQSCCGIFLQKTKTRHLTEKMMWQTLWIKTWLSSCFRLSFRFFPSSCLDDLFRWELDACLSKSCRSGKIRRAFQQLYLCGDANLRTLVLVFLFFLFRNIEEKKKKKAPKKCQSQACVCVCVCHSARGFLFRLLCFLCSLTCLIYCWW